MAEQTKREFCLLTPLHVGVCRLGKNYLLGSPFTDDERIDLTLYAFLVECPNGEKALIDLGPKTLDYTNRMFRKYHFFRETDGEKINPDDIVQDFGNVFDHLKRLGVSPGEIDHIVLTHLHADHHGMDDATDGGAMEDFPHATLHVSRKGWEFNLRARKDGHWNSYLDWGFGDSVLRFEREGRLHAEDDARVASGIHTLYLGGHSICSQAICVETEWGTAVLTSDDIYRYDFLERGRLARIFVEPGSLIRATDRMVRKVQEENGFLVPVHDPCIWDMYRKAGNRWPELAVCASRRAVESYVKLREAGKVLHAYQVTA